MSREIVKTVQCKTADKPEAEWRSSAFTAHDLEEKKYVPQSRCDYRIIDQYGNVLREYKWNGEGAYEVIKDNIEYEGYYYNPVAVPWHEAVEDIIKNDAVYLCKYTNAPVSDSNFRVTHTPTNESTELGFIDSDGDAQEFKIESFWFTAKWHKEVGKVEPKPTYSIPDGVYYTVFLEDDPLTAKVWCTETPATGWIRSSNQSLEGILQGKYDTYRGKFVYVKDGVVSKEFTVKG